MDTLNDTEVVRTVEIINPPTTLNLMLDMETLGTQLGCCVLSIALVPFNLPPAVAEITPPFYTRLDYTTQAEYGLCVDLATLKWWMKQSEDAREEAFSGTEELAEVLVTIQNWVRQLEIVFNFPRINLWSKGSDFDCKLLEKLYEIYEIEFPFSFRNFRCFRTLQEIFPEIQAPQFQGTKHSALDDARHQALHAEILLDYAKQTERKQV